MGVLTLTNSVWKGDSENLLQTLKPIFAFIEHFFLSLSSFTDISIKFLRQLLDLISSTSEVGFSCKERKVYLEA